MSERDIVRAKLDKKKQMENMAAAAAYGDFQSARQANKGRNNGRLLTEGLLRVGGGNMLRPRAAKSFVAMRKAAREAGIKFKINDSYRTYGEQVDLANQIGLYSEGGLAAKPGTSKHGEGRAVDLSVGGYGTDTYKWLKQNAGKFGFVGDVDREPWHWEFNPKQFNKDIIEGINLKKVGGGFRAVAGPGYDPISAPLKTTAKPQTVTDGKDNGTFKDTSTSTSYASKPKTSVVGNAAGLSAPTLGRAKVL